MQKHKKEYKKVDYITDKIHKSLYTYTLVKCKLDMECLTLEIGSNLSNFT